MGSEHHTTGFITTYIQDNILDINQALLEYAYERIS